MQSQPRQSCAAKLLDVRGYVIAARNGMQNAEPSTALFMIVVFGIIALVLTPIYLTFDLGSTWAFTTGVRDAATPAIGDTVALVERTLNITLGGILTGAIFTGFTLLPSLFELAFPTIAHPLLSIVLWISIVFDYITDWGKAWNLVGTWVENPVGRFLICVPLCAFLSVFVQALLVISLTVIIFGLIALVSGGKRQAEAIIIRQ
jgi:hypothetical protein